VGELAVSRVTAAARRAQCLLALVRHTYIAPDRGMKEEAAGENVPSLEVPIQFTSAATDTRSDQAMIVFILTSALALAMMWMARQLLQPKWEHLAHRFPAQLLHRWSLGLIGLTALYIFFVAPFLLLGQYVVAAASFFVTTIIITLSARDVVDWIVDDIREHRAEKRSFFLHSDNCVVHEHYGRSDGHPPVTP
jgi:hypothetical protein